MTRRARTLAASLAPALLPLALAAAGCDDARLGGNDGVRTPGDSPAAGAKQQTNPSSPVVGGAVTKAGDAPK